MAGPYLLVGAGWLWLRSRLKQLENIKAVDAFALPPKTDDDEKYRLLVTRIGDAVLVSARWGSDANSHLLNSLKEIIEKENTEWRDK